MVLCNIFCSIEHPFVRIQKSIHLLENLRPRLKKEIEDLPKAKIWQPTSTLHYYMCHQYEWVTARHTLPRKRLEKIALSRQTKQNQLRHSSPTSRPILKKIKPITMTIYLKYFGTHTKIGVYRDCLSIQSIKNSLRRCLPSHAKQESVP